MARILVVDDSRAIVESAIKLLESWGHEARGVLSGTAALNETLSYRPEVALLDLNLPDVDGFDLASQLRGHPDLEHIIIIAMTGDSESLYRDRSREAGCDALLIKPFRADSLRKLLPVPKAARTLVASPSPRR